MNHPERTPCPSCLAGALRCFIRSQMAPSRNCRPAPFALPCFIGPPLLQSRPREERPLLPVLSLSLVDGSSGNTFWGMEAQTRVSPRLPISPSPRSPPGQGRGVLVRASSSEYGEGGRCPTRRGCPAF